MSCSSCGAALRAETAWCGQCFAPAGPRPHAVPQPPAGARPAYSRWASGPTSFGPVGRVLLTLLVLLVEYWLYRFNILGFLVVTVLAVPLVLRDIWKRARV